MATVARHIPSHSPPNKLFLYERKVNRTVSTQSPSSSGKHGSRQNSTPGEFSPQQHTPVHRGHYGGEMYENMRHAKPAWDYSQPNKPAWKNVPTVCVSRTKTGKPLTKGFDGSKPPHPRFEHYWQGAGINSRKYNNRLHIECPLQTFSSVSNNSDQMRAATNDHAPEPQPSKALPVKMPRCVLGANSGSIRRQNIYENIPNYFTRSYSYNSSDGRVHSVACRKPGTAHLDIAATHFDAVECCQQRSLRRKAPAPPKQWQGVTLRDVEQPRRHEGLRMMSTPPKNYSIFTSTSSSSSRPIGGRNAQCAPICPNSNELGWQKRKLDVPWAGAHQRSVII